MSRPAAASSLRLVAWTVALLTCANAAAAENGPTLPRNRRVAVLPVQNYVASAETIWGTDSGTDPEAVALERFLIRRLAVEPTLDVVGPEAIRKRLGTIRAHREGGRLGLERMGFGMDLYKGLHVDRAIPHLEQAHAALTTAFHDIVDPSALSELNLTLALCYQEQKQSHKAHVALKEMFLNTPTRRFKPGFYSKPFEAALRSAVTDFVATWPRENPLGKPARLQRFLEDLDVDVLVFAWLEGTPEGTRVRIAVHDRYARNVSHRGAFVATDRAADLEQIDRFVSRWTTCLPPQVGEAPKAPEAEWEFYLDTTFVYSMFTSLLGSDPLTGSAFQNLGMAVNLEWQFLGGLGVFSRVAMLISTQDPERDLTDTFPSLRTTVGMFYAYKRRAWRVFTRFGVDAQFLLSDFTVATHRWCKWDLAHPNCVRTELKTFEDEYLVGFHADIGVNVFLNPALYATLRTGITAYVMPSDRVDLNFPLTFELGLGYRF